MLVATKRRNIFLNMSALEDPQILERLQPEEYYRRWIDANYPRRPNLRLPMQARPISLEGSVINTAESSATCLLGSPNGEANTFVVAAIKAEVAQPSLNSEAPFIVPNVTLAAGCSPSIRAGPPSDQAQLYSSMLADLLDISTLIDLKKLNTDQLVWTLHIDAIVLSDAGSVMSAVWLAVVKALQGLALPSVKLTDVDGKGTMAAVCQNSQGLTKLIPDGVIPPILLSFVYLSQRYKDYYAILLVGINYCWIQNTTKRPSLVDKALLFCSLLIDPFFTRTSQAAFPFQPSVLLSPTNQCRLTWTRFIFPSRKQFLKFDESPEMEAELLLPILYSD